MAYDRTKPFNDLPFLPPNPAIENDVEATDNKPFKTYSSNEF